MLPICLAAMNAGKHAATEVPAALTVDECWQLVETSEKTGRHCVMLENDCYYRETLLALNMVQDGLLGEPLYAEAGYLHDIRAVKFNTVPNGEPWRLDHSVRETGISIPLTRLVQSRCGRNQPGRPVQLPGLHEFEIAIAEGVCREAVRAERPARQDELCARRREQHHHQNGNGPNDLSLSRHQYAPA